jgi:amino acid permease
MYTLAYTGVTFLPYAAGGVGLLAMAGCTYAGRYLTRKKG